jgi:enoyl-CoA hydratase/carnithine racemase
MPEVLYEVRDRTAFITLNRPEQMNALNTALRTQLRDCLLQFRDDPEVWTAVITGAGDRAFSAGADLKEAAAGRRNREEGGEAPARETNIAAVLRADMEKIMKPMIAAINGYCLAGGLELALRCDIRIAADHAKFALTEVARGLLPGGGGTQRLPRAVPLGMAMEMIFTAEHIDAAEAYRIGLVNRIMPLADLMPAAEELARKINANAPISVRASKEAIIRGMSTSLEEGLLIEAEMARVASATEDAREGPRAFAEKRPAQFRGR